MITLDIMREVVNANKPYRTGYMFMFGTRFNETDAYLSCYYDTTAVPYIVHNEEGHNNNPNEGFISVKTVTALNAVTASASLGDMSILQGAVDSNARRSRMASQGVYEHMKQYGRASGVVYEHYVG